MGEDVARWIGRRAFLEYEGEACECSSLRLWLSRNGVSKYLIKTEDVE